MTHYWFYIINRRGDSFRQEFSQLGKLRSIIPKHVHVMVLTATATVSTRKEIIKILRTTMDRIIVFCRTYDEVTTVYYYFKHQLGRGFTEPQGAPDTVQFHLVGMYTYCTRQTVKDKILIQFTSLSSLRLVIATVAFGMGIVCPNVRQVIHWGVPEDAEMYVLYSQKFLLFLPRRVVGENFFGELFYPVKILSRYTHRFLHMAAKQYYTSSSTISWYSNLFILHLQPSLMLLLSYSTSLLGFCPIPPEPGQHTSSSSRAASQISW